MKQHLNPPRLIEIILGLLFLLAAYLKAKDPNLFVAQIYGYGVITDPDQLRFIAIFATSIEAALGLALLLKLRLGILTHAATQLMLAFYTLLIAYAWAINGLEDCGCFGDVKIPPQMGILKNLVMMAALSYAMWKMKADTSPTAKHIHLIKLGAAVLCGVLCALYIVPQLSKASPAANNTPVDIQSTARINGGETPEIITTETPETSKNPPDPRFTNITGSNELTGENYDLANGMYILTALNMDCEHCMEAVPTLNEFAFDPNLPPVVAVCWEPEPGQTESFTALTGPQFPMFSLGNDFLKFSQYIGSAPPRISIIKDGHELFYWDKEAPTVDAMYQKLDELKAELENPAVDTENTTQGN